MKKINLIVVFLIGLILLPIKINAASLLSGLEIEGIGNLNVAKKSWNLGFSTSLNYANVTATPADESVKVEGDGKVDIKEGANTITVTASKGEQTETYTINLNVTKKAGNGGSTTSSSSKVSYDKDGNEIKNPNTGAFMNIAFVTLLGSSIALIAIKSNKKKKFYRI